ncbi:helix-turn-helix domain-containing protein [Tistrella mobilis]|uniref:Transcriptional regulator n=1 Tax=Tistrella mobilis (strain KA081020-065) TaxID=1110502 RepID=I3TRI6_TISMK|nr:helix-turn-helix transcriptional regulator [Tistrella mobilis]AFK55374.1 transcriptional regulator [Tistrella mobilis KA081020-065]MAM72450.1 XRE family transcriptional regulator [Tistrella sp.]
MATRLNPIDAHVGGRVRLRRQLMGLSQEKLGQRVGLTFQQIQKYERGANRIGAGRLFLIAHALNVPVSFFYEDVGAVTPDRGADGLDDGFDWMVMDGPEAQTLAFDFARISDPRARARVVELARTISDGLAGLSQKIPLDSDVTP